MRIIGGELSDQILPNEYAGKYPFPFNPSYREFINRTEKGSVILVEKDESVMPVLKKSRGGFTIWRCLFPPLHDGQRLTKDEEANFLDHVVSELGKQRLAQRIIQSPTYALFKSAPSKSTWAPFGSYVIDFETQDLSDIWMGMKSNYRQVIRKADREGVTVLTGVDQLETFYSLFETTTKRSRIYKEPYSYFEQLTKKLTSKHVYCSVAWVDGNPDGGIFVLYSQYGAYVLYAGSADNIRHPGSMKLLHWTAMQYMKKNGVRCYDFVGARLTDVSDSPLSGIQRFKNGFGSELKEGVLWKCDIDPVLCKLADTVQYIRHAGNSRHEDIIDQEISKISV